jgi:hypothetical protein
MWVDSASVSHASQHAIYRGGLRILNHQKGCLFAAIPINFSSSRGRKFAFTGLRFCPYEKSSMALNDSEETMLDFLQGGGAMGKLIRAYDWAKTPLGPPTNWPQSLRSALSICLHSSFPTAIYWGEDLCLLYNDAWAHIPGDRHPFVLGQQQKSSGPISGRS